MNQMFQLLTCCDYLFANFFRIDGHAAFGRHLEGFEAVRSSDEVTLSRFLRLRTAVGIDKVPESCEELQGIILGRGCGCSYCDHTATSEWTSLATTKVRLYSQPY
ncbi:hypothetical protein D9M71_801080 [compost metagenome]